MSMSLQDLTTSFLYGEFITFSSDNFATATAVSNGDGGFTLAPATGVDWTNDTSVVGGGGSVEAVNISVPTVTSGSAAGSVDPYAETNGILEFVIAQADGTFSQPFYGQIIGWNDGVVAFQAYQNYTSDGTTGTLSDPIAAVPYFYLSTTALAAGAEPPTGVSINTTSPAPAIFDPEYPVTPVPLLLNNPDGELLDGFGNSWSSLVGTTFDSNDVAIIDTVSQNPSTLALTTGAGETFATANDTNVSIVAAYNDAQVVELQYTNAQGDTVDVYGQLIGTGQTDLLFQVYTGFNPQSGAVSSPDTSLPFILLSKNSLSGGVPVVIFNQDTAGGDINAPAGGEDLTAFGLTAASGLATWSLNLHDLFGVTASGGGITISSDQFAIITDESGRGIIDMATAGDWANSGNAVVDGGTTVQVTAVYDDWQVVAFQVTQANGSQTTVYGQVIGWNGAEIAFNAFSAFDDVNGPSGSINGMASFVLATTPTAVSGAGNTDQSLYVASAIGPIDAPLFLNPSTPAPNLDLSTLVSNSFRTPSDYVAFASVVQQNPTTLAFSILPSHSVNQTWTGVYGVGTTGSVVVENVYAVSQPSLYTFGQTQIMELGFEPSGTSTPSKTVYAQFIGYNADTLLLQVLPGFNPATGTWAPSVGNVVGTYNADPYMVISDVSLIASDGMPIDDVFTSNGALAPLSLLPLCFCAGTLIATPTGEAAVETLARGDTVLTAKGQARRVTWIGRGRVLATRGRRGPATPVIVRKGALADNVPHADLHVTKGHAFLVDGVLIPVEFLVNHRSILWDDRAQEVSLYHVELDTHDVLLANGAPAESYRDDGNRWLFQNANTGWGLPPRDPCAPVLTGGPVVDAVWRQLLDRTGPRRGAPLTEDADLHLLVDGSRVDANGPSDGRPEAGGPDGMIRVFALPASARSVRIVSRSAVPAELGLARDPRELGVAVRRLVLRQGTWFRAIALTDPALQNGFHDPEPADGIRWTNGDADLPVSLFAGRSGRLELVLHLGGSTRYIDDGSVVRVA
ncbi:Hint domain-containing protein [Acidisphaera sp. S103]|uniref:Hint domain-containing protein n=1 Tax=Acidisphaera sp. S103 TaxID=1747223 RepID=UPI00131A64B0|nr:Hint domain-containing protein [Acidisphaera sp. S103]